MIVSSGNTLTDRNPLTCVTSKQLRLTVSNPEHRITVQSNNNNRVTIQILHGETSDDRICVKVEDVLFTLLVAPSGCRYYKSCEMSWGMWWNRIYEYQCPCPENGNCILNLFHTNMTNNWSICNMHV